VKQTKSERPTRSFTAEGNRAEGRKAGQADAPLARSKTPARTDLSSAREPGDLQLALPDVLTGELVREPQEGERRTRRLKKSDRPVVPKKPANKGRLHHQTAELVEERGLAEGKAVQGNPPRTQGRRIGGKTGLARIGAQARRQAETGEKTTFTNLFNHLRVDLLREVFYRLKRKAAPGVDGQTWEDYAEGLEDRLVALQDRLHRGAYRPPPVRRQYIPKADGRMRPLGIPAIEDKIVQGAVVALLTPIYEAEFLDCSYGFRPRHNQHQALEAVDRMMYRGYVNWVLDADIKAYFDTIQHQWLVKMLEHRIGDKRLIRLIQRWLKAGVLEDGEWRATEEGSPQGGLISPLLANAYLHYVLDLWFAKEARRMRGRAHLVRYADDFIVGFQYEHEAKSFQKDLAERLGQFGLALHPTKTRLLRFGKFARRDCRKDGRRRPETFDFLGFTHISGRSTPGGFKLIRRTARKKRMAKMAALKQEMRKRMHWCIRDQWQYLCGVLRGHYQYYGVPTNYRALRSFRDWVRRTWHRLLQRRSQKARLNRRRLDQLDQRYPLIRPRIRPLQPQLQLALVPRTRGRSRMR
jgi:group II intron reverse transcriptase/maturase